MIKHPKSFQKIGNFNRLKLRISLDFIKKYTWKLENKEGNVLKYLGKNYFQPRILCPPKLSSKCKGEIKMDNLTHLKC